MILNIWAEQGYTGHIEVDLESNLLHGRVLDIKDVITFEGATIDEVKQAFYDSVDDYLDFCAETGDESDKPSLLKRFNLR
jgi:predicted HicB family RNase H-like nuclease